jgi:hypothetical protein
MLTSEGSRSWHILPSPSPHLDLLGGPSHHPHFEMWAIPCTATINEAEAGLVNALVASVGRTRSIISPDQVRAHLSRFYKDGDFILAIGVSMRRYGEEDFLLVFSEAGVADHVLHVEPHKEAGLLLLFR